MIAFATHKWNPAKRLIKAATVILLLFLQLAPVIDFAPGHCQSRKLPRAGFQRFSNSLPAGPSGSLSGTSGMTTPGVHLTAGYDRTARNAKEPFNPGEPTLNMALVRWQRQKMPLRVWISPGLELPGLPFEQLQATRVETVFQMLQLEDPFAGLSQARGWTEQCNYQVAAGFEQWRMFEHEGLLSFGFTSNPRDAHILVFFVDQFQGAAGPGGINVGGNTCAQLFTQDQLLLPQYRQKPVVIELSCMVNHLPEKMTGAAAHEFGHALGIKAHSPFRDDIMYADRVVNNLSEGDKSTLRLLYRAEPKFVM
jgi:hypothetical protein